MGNSYILLIYTKNLILNHPFSWQKPILKTLNHCLIFEETGGNSWVTVAFNLILRSDRNTLTKTPSKTLSSWQRQCLRQCLRHDTNVSCCVQTGRHSRRQCLRQCLPKLTNGFQSNLWDLSFFWLIKSPRRTMHSAKHDLSKDGRSLYP